MRIPFWDSRFCSGIPRRIQTKRVIFLNCQFSLLAPISWIFDSQPFSSFWCCKSWLVFDRLWLYTALANSLSLINKKLEVRFRSTTDGNLQLNFGEFQKFASQFGYSKFIDIQIWNFGSTQFSSSLNGEHLLSVSKTKTEMPLIIPRQSRTLNA